MAKKFAEYRSKNPLVASDHHTPLKQRATSSQLFLILNGVTQKASGCAKFTALLKRNAVNLIKNPGILGIRLAMYMMLSLMIGLMYLNLED